MMGRCLSNFNATLAIYS